MYRSQVLLNDLQPPLTNVAASAMFKLFYVFCFVLSDDIAVTCPCYLS